MSSVTETPQTPQLPSPVKETKTGIIKFDTKEMTPLSRAFSEFVLSRLQEIDFEKLYKNIIASGSYDEYSGAIIEIVDLICSVQSLHTEEEFVPGLLLEHALTVKHRLNVGKVTQEKVGRNTVLSVVKMLVSCDAFVNHGKEINGKKIKTLEDTKTAMYM